MRFTTYAKWDLTQREGDLCSDRFVGTGVTAVRER